MRHGSGAENPSVSHYEAVASRDMRVPNRVTELCLAEEPADRYENHSQAGDERSYLREARAPLSLDEGRVLGQVTSVDAGRLLVTLADDEAIERASVSALVALHAGDGFLLGIIDRLTCSENLERVVAHIMPVGAFYPSPSGGGTFRLGTAHQPRIRARCFLVEGERLSQFMASVADGVSPDERLVLGRYGDEDGATAVGDGNRLFQRHLAILGNSGAGKSWAVALLMERAARLQSANLVVLDLHGEYGPLAEAGMATRLRIAGAADEGQDADDLLHLPYWLLEIDELGMLVLNEDDPHCGDQRLWLIQKIEGLKRSSLAMAGSYNEMVTATVDSPVPYRIEDLLHAAERDEVEQVILQPSGKVLPGPYAGKLRGLITRIEARQADPRFSFIFQPPDGAFSTDWLPQMAIKLLQAGVRVGIKAIDVSEAPTSLIPLVAGLLARLIYDIQFWTDPAHRTPVCLVCDEAHVYLREGAAAESPVHAAAMHRFETIAKEGRKYGVCLAVVSQRPSELNQTVLSQCNNFVILRLSNDLDHEAIVRLVPGAFAGVADVLPTLDVGEAVVIGDAVPLPIRMKLDRATNGPNSQTIPYWSLWANQRSSPDALVDGVASLRAQTRDRIEEEQPVVESAPRRGVAPDGWAAGG